MVFILLVFSPTAAFDPWIPVNENFTQLVYYYTSLFAYLVYHHVGIQITNLRNLPPQGFDPYTPAKLAICCSYILHFNLVTTSPWTE